MTDVFKEDAYTTCDESESSPLLNLSDAVGAPSRPGTQHTEVHDALNPSVDVPAHLRVVRERAMRKVLVGEVRCGEDAHRAGADGS